MLRKQNAEKMDLDRLLGKEEREAMDNLMKEHEIKRRQLMEDQEQKLNAQITRMSEKLLVKQLNDELF